MKSSSPYASKLFAEDKYLKQELKTRRPGFGLGFWHAIFHSNILDIIKALNSENPLLSRFPILNTSVVLFICNWDLAHFFITAVS